MKNKAIYMSLLAVTAALCSGCSPTSAIDILEKFQQVIVDEVENQQSKTDPHIQVVKNGVLEAYPNKSVGDAFELFFADPKWKYFKADTKEDVVEFAGYCEYSGVRVLVRMQFIVDGKGFQVGAISFNDMPQNRFMSVGLFEKIYEPYNEENLNVLQEDVYDEDIYDENIYEQGVYEEDIKETVIDNSYEEPIDHTEDYNAMDSDINGRYFIAQNYVNHMTEKIDWSYIIGVNASSQLKNEGSYIYEPIQTLDNDYSTAWVEGVYGDGKGEWLRYDLESESVVQVIGIVNGLADNEDLYYANNRVKEVEITFSNGESITMMLSDNEMELQTISLPQEIKTDNIKITILSTYPGTKYDDTCIGEVGIMYYHKYQEEAQDIYKEIVDNIVYTGEIIDLSMDLVELLYVEEWAGYTDYVFEYDGMPYLLRWWEEENKPVPDFKNGPISIVQTGEEEYITHRFTDYAIGCELP